MIVILYPSLCCIYSILDSHVDASLDSSDINQLLNSDRDGLSLKANKAVGTSVCFFFIVHRCVSESF